MSMDLYRMSLFHWIWDLSNRMAYFRVVIHILHIVMAQLDNRIWHVSLNLSN